MLRRTWLRILTSIPLMRHITAAPAAFVASEQKLIAAIAHAVLPESLGASQVDAIAVRFGQWIAGYRAGAEMEHGYGITRMAVKPPSPLTAYREQLSKLGPDFAALPIAARRSRISAAMVSAGVTALPQYPNGQHVATDLMAFWFRSGEANDICYQRAIQRYECRGFATAGEQPPSLVNKIDRGRRA